MTNPESGPREPEDEIPKEEKEKEQTPEEILGRIMAEEEIRNTKEVESLEEELKKLKEQSAFLEEKLRKAKEKRHE